MCPILLPFPVVPQSFVINYKIWYFDIWYWYIKWQINAMQTQSTWPQEKAKSASNKLTKVQLKKRKRLFLFIRSSRNLKEIFWQINYLAKKTIKEFISLLPNKFFKREVFQRGDSKKIITLFWADVVYKQLPGHWYWS